MASSERFLDGLSNSTSGDQSRDGVAHGFVVGIDLGGTKILAGIAGCDGHVLATCEEPTRHGADAPVLDQMVSIVGNLLARVGAGLGSLRHVVIGIPSAVDPATGLASLSPNLALPADVPLSTLLGSRLPCAVSVENDVNLAAFAEAAAGAGKAENSLAFLSFGTGVGMGLVVNGKIWRGAYGRAGEIAYLPIGGAPHDGAPLSDNGLYEDAVGSHGIRNRFAPAEGSVRALFEAVRRGDAEARAALEEIARSASLGVAAIHAMVDPALTVIGGGIGNQPEFFDFLKAHLTPLLPFSCRLEASHFGPEAGMIGAVMMAVRHVDEMIERN